MKSVRMIDGQHVEALVLDGIVTCGKCSQPTLHLEPKTTQNGTIEDYCTKCHLSYVEEDNTLLG